MKKILVCLIGITLAGCTTVEDMNKALLHYKGRHISQISSKIGHPDEYKIIWDKSGNDLAYSLKKDELFDKKIEKDINDLIKKLGAPDREVSIWKKVGDNYFFYTNNYGHMMPFSYGATCVFLVKMDTRRIIRGHKVLAFDVHQCSDYLDKLE